MHLRLGTRRSPLARAQAEFVAGCLRSLPEHLTVELVEVTTGGDRSQGSDAPGPGWGEGVFVKELEQAILEGLLDAAVHSLKDLPPRLTAGLALLAVPEREHPGDVLVTRDGRGFEDLRAGAILGTSSARRSAFLRHARPDLDFRPIRGNVETRCRKLDTGQFDAIVLARAGLERLGLRPAWVELDPGVLPPAPGQGALAIQGRVENSELGGALRALDHTPTRSAVEAERRLMSELDGGCRLPVAALGTPTGSGGLHLLGAVAAPDGARVARAEAHGSLADPDELALRVAALLRSRGASEMAGAFAGVVAW